MNRWRPGLAKHAGRVHELRTTFAVLRGDDNPLKKRRNGYDIDLDAVVESYVDSRTGKELSDCVFAKKRELERDMAVAFAVDMSGSTKG